MPRKRKLNRFNDPGPFMQNQGLTPEQIKGVELQNKAFDLAAKGDYSLGIKIGIFSESALEEDNDSN